MSLSDMIMPEFKQEMANTRRTLDERDEPFDPSSRSARRFRRAVPSIYGRRPTKVGFRLSQKPDREGGLIPRRPDKYEIGDCVRVNCLAVDAQQ